MEFSKQITKICIFSMITIIISILIVMTGKYLIMLKVITEKQAYYDNLERKIDYAVLKAKNDRDGLWKANEDKNGKVDQWIIEWIYEIYYKELELIEKQYSHSL